MFQWNSKKEEAALLVAQDELSNEKIAEKAGVTRQALDKWKANPDFKARVESHIDAFRSRVRRRGIAVIENRVARLNERCELMDRVIQERGQSEEMQGVPGGGTGLLARNVKGIGRGEDFQVVEVFEVDTGLLNELRQHEKQAAQELGQWADKVEHAGGVSLYTKTTKGVSQDDL